MIQPCASIRCWSAGSVKVGLERQQVVAERVLAVVAQHRKIELALVVDHERPVVGDELRPGADQEDRREDDQRPEPPPMRAEDGEAPGVQAHPRASKSIRGSTTV